MINQLLLKEVSGGEQLGKHDKIRVEAREKVFGGVQIFFHLEIPRGELYNTPCRLKADLHEKAMDRRL